MHRPPKGPIFTYAIVRMRCPEHDDHVIVMGGDTKFCKEAAAFLQERETALGEEVAISFVEMPDSDLFDLTWMMGRKSHVRDN